MSSNDIAAVPSKTVVRVLHSKLAEANAPIYRPVKVVAIGGGTGLSTILKGLKHYVQPQWEVAPEIAEFSSPVISELTAVVTVTDDGGSSGRLRKEFNMLPPGDIRNCLVALSLDEALLARLFQYRFRSESGLDGHSFGNLFLAALTGVTKDFGQAIRLASAILATSGRILPSTNSDVQLCAEMADGTHVFGESSITNSSGRIVRLKLVPADVEPMPETLAAIAEADLITVGPGSLFTSLVSNLLVRGISEAIAASPALKVYVCNLMTQANETLGFTAADHIATLCRHAGRRIFDYALVNETAIPAELLAKYDLESATQVLCDDQAVEELGVRVVKGNYLAEGPLVRHAPEKVANDLFALVYGSVNSALQQKRHAVNL
jgi:uncharacterized cofD-like protein